MSACLRCIIGKCDGYFQCDHCQELYPDDEQTVATDIGMVLCDECNDNLRGER